MWQWRAVDATLWDFRAGVVCRVLLGLFAAGWVAVPAVSLPINHFDLFGTRQVWLHLQRREYSHLPFRTPGAYRFVRHPLYIAWGLAFWATPTMTVGHCVFAAAMSAYMVIATFFEERDLVAFFGEAYEEYRRRVSRFVPGFPNVLRAFDSTALRDTDR
jgi:protein-S-isoprenylcysteine O-methyltransferase Ste14